MKKLLTVGLILSLSIGSAQARFGSFASPFNQAQLKKRLKIAQQAYSQAVTQDTQAGKEVKRLEKMKAVAVLVNAAKSKQRISQQVMNNLQNRVNQAQQALKKAIPF